MRLVTGMLVVFALLTFSAAFADIKPCEELKAEIEAKLKAKGVKAYTLEVVASDQVSGQKAVGTCEAGKKKIIYSREAAKK